MLPSIPWRMVASSTAVPIEATNIWVNQRRRGCAAHDMDNAPEDEHEPDDVNDDAHHDQRQAANPVDCRFHPQVETATLGLVYKFNWTAPAPVVAKY
jgi:hypothetical protein